MMKKLYTRRHVLGLGSTLVISALLAACGEDTDDDSTGGSGSSDSTATPADPTQAPSTPTAAGIDYPTEPDAAVLKVEIEGGFVAAEEILSRIPLIAIYGDGRVFTLGPQIEIFPQPAEVPLQVARISPEGIQAILAEAQQVGLLDGDAHYPIPNIADAATTVFTVTADGQTSRTSVYGLQIDTATEDEEQRQKLRNFLTRVTSYPEWLPPEAILEPATPTDPERLQIVTYPVVDGGGGEIEPQQLEWPLETSPSEIGEPFFFPGPAGSEEARCAVLEGEELQSMLAAIKQANRLTQWMASGQAYRLMNRPLLPDEEGCVSPFDGDGHDHDDEEQPAGSYRYPTAPDAVVVRYELTGGFVPAEMMISQIPQFSLFGDGMVVQPGAQIAIYPPPALPSLTFEYLSPAGIETILAEADAAGLLQGDQSWMELTGTIADASTGVLTLTANGQTSRIEVYAPGMVDSMGELSEEAREFRMRFDGFVTRLTNLASWLPENAYAERDDEYPLDRLQIISQPAGLANPGDGSVEPDQVDWPLETPLQELGEPVPMIESGRCFVVEGEAFATLKSMLSDATVITRWSSAGELYVLYPRPLLPDEEGCEFDR